MICGSNRGGYGKLVEELQNNFTKEKNYYPAYLTEEYNLLLNYKTLHSKLEARLVDFPEEVPFGNVGGYEGRRVNMDGRVSGCCGKKVWCYCCIKLGHIATECTNQKEAVVDNAVGEK